MMMSAQDVCISAGSACHAHVTTPSRVLVAMGMSAEDAMCTIRVSFSSATTQEEVAAAAVKLVATIKTLRG